MNKMFISTRRKRWIDGVQISIRLNSSSSSGVKNPCQALDFTSELKPASLHDLLAPNHAVPLQPLDLGMHSSRGPAGQLRQLVGALPRVLVYKRVEFVISIFALLGPGDLGLLGLLQGCQISSGKADYRPKEAFARRFPGKGDKVQKSLDLLAREGYIRKHPTGGAMTYQRTDIGRAKCHGLRESIQ